ncbi:hypothetical protein RF11_12768 [Thelohanellus kitauei]|uniref:Globin domain-containing protein n=1 Tax=Thelohanellus kitauei TaxID=669202 RepID=A0A0C2MAJ9_THEKT|nr:hypothetical protein RF11_12768 [Thelohanellus kitauei]
MKWASELKNMICRNDVPHQFVQRKQVARKMKNYDEAFNTYFAKQSKKYGCQFDSLDEEEVSIIKKKYAELLPIFQSPDNNLGQMVFREMMKSGKFSHYFSSDKFTPDYTDVHGSAINSSLIKTIESLEDHPALMKIRSGLENTHHELMIKTDDFDTFMTIFFDVLKNQAKASLFDEEVVAWEKLLLFVYNCFRKKIYGP